MSLAPIITFIVAFGVVMVLVAAGFYHSTKRFADAVQPWQTSLSALIGFMAVVMTISTAQQREEAARFERIDSEQLALVTEQQQMLFSVIFEVRRFIDRGTELGEYLEEAVQAGEDHRTSDCRAAIRRMRQVEFAPSNALSFDGKAKLQLSFEYQSDVVSFRQSWADVERKLNSLEPKSACSGSAGFVQMRFFLHSMDRLLEHGKNLNIAGGKEMKQVVNNLKYMTKVR